jgi:hypothetical protein
MAHTDVVGNHKSHTMRTKLDDVRFRTVCEAAYGKWIEAIEHRALSTLLLTLNHHS